MNKIASENCDRPENGLPTGVQDEIHMPLSRRLPLLVQHLAGRANIAIVFSDE
jgi:hypothetical protein